MGEEAAIQTGTTRQILTRPGWVSLRPAFHTPLSVRDPFLSPDWASEHCSAADYYQWTSPWAAPSFLSIVAQCRSQLSGSDDPSSPELDVPTPRVYRLPHFPFFFFFFALPAPRLLGASLRPKFHLLSIRIYERGLTLISFAP
jgi:hypothetical protein